MYIYIYIYTHAHTQVVEMTGSGFRAMSHDTNLNLLVLFYSPEVTDKGSESTIRGSGFRVQCFGFRRLTPTSTSSSSSTPRWLRTS